MIDREKILDTLVWGANSITGFLQFEEWDGGGLEIPGTSIFKIKNFLRNFQKDLKDMIDWNNLSVEDCKFLGFTKCFPNEQGIDEELGKEDISRKDKLMLLNLKNLWIIPGYLLPILPGDLEVCTSFGDKITLEPGSETVSTKNLKSVSGNIGIIPIDKR